MIENADEQQKKEKSGMGLLKTGGHETRPEAACTQWKADGRLRNR
jgi:hypothetical protein